jgi:5-formyltetrahydrofolate cyclo-ligase
MQRNILEQKSKMRQEMRNKLLCVPYDERKRRSSLIINNLKKFSPYDVAQSICIYLSTGFEVKTTSFVRQLLRDGTKKVVVPVVHGDRLILSELRNWEELRPGYKGTLEPKEEHRRVVSVESIDLFVVPGQAFTRRGHRLGQGGGHYDRLLQHVTTPTVGLAYECQMCNHIPVSDNPSAPDVPLHAIITEKRRYHGR